MNSDSQKIRECFELVIISFEENLNQAQSSRLNDLLRDRMIRNFYLDLIELCFGLNEMPWTQVSNSPFLLPSTWQLLARYEKEAEIAKLPIESKPVELVEDVRKRKAQLKTAKKKTPLSLWISFGSLVAVMMLFLYIAHLPHAKPVAEVLDMLDAQWDMPLQKGDTFYSRGSVYTLRQGYAKIGLEDGVVICLESPVQFSFDSYNKLNLKHGRITATVPRSAIGFVVTTPNSQIIDLGTEFGVFVTLARETEVHLFRGKVNLLSSFFRDADQTQILNQGQAVIIDSDSRILPIQLTRNGFVKDIDSQHGIVWRGEPIDLADIVGGGNGLGTGLRGSSIDPADGRWHSLSALLTQDFNQPSQKPFEAGYRPVLSSPFVDGVFVPDGAQAPVIVSSSGHIFEEVPLTSGEFWHGVVYWDAARGRSIVFNDELFGTSQKPALLMHANVGITFDLEAIRRNFSGRSITEFVSFYGISDAYADKKVEPSADFWVLVDGHIRFSKKNMTVLQSGTVQIPIYQSDRFLTLVTTEGENNFSAEQHGKGPTFNDWCVWGSPVLIVK